MSGPPEHVVDWAQQRARHRAAGDYAAADALRDRIAGAGWRAVDSKDAFAFYRNADADAAFGVRSAGHRARPCVAAELPASPRPLATADGAAGRRLG